MRHNKFVAGTGFLLTLLLALVIVLLFRMSGFKPELQPVVAVNVPALSEHVVTRLSQTVQIPTISALSDSVQREQNFRYFHAFLAQSFSRIYAASEWTSVSDYENAIRFYYQLITNTVINPVFTNDG